MRKIWVQYTRGAYDHVGVVDEWATNDRDGGVFTRRADGTWQQHKGNGQTPVFSGPAHFRRYLRAHFDVKHARIIDTAGW